MPSLSSVPQASAWPLAPVDSCICGPWLAGCPQSLSPLIGFHERLSHLGEIPPHPPFPRNVGSQLYLPQGVSGLPWWLSSEEFACSAGDGGSIPGSPGKMPWRREWLPTPVFLPGESHGQRRLAGYSPRGRKELGMTEAT